MFAQQSPRVGIVPASLLCKRVGVRVRGSIVFPTSLLCNGTDGRAKERNGSRKNHLKTGVLGDVMGSGGDGRARRRKDKTRGIFARQVPNMGIVPASLLHLSTFDFQGTF